MKRNNSKLSGTQFIKISSNPVEVIDKDRKSDLSIAHALRSRVVMQFDRENLRKNVITHNCIAAAAARKQLKHYSVIDLTLKNDFLTKDLKNRREYKRGSHEIASLTSEGKLILKIIIV